jgi:hypothetical protein
MKFSMFWLAMPLDKARLASFGFTFSDSAQWQRTARAHLPNPG